MPLHWKCSILTTGPPGTSPIIFWSNRYFYLFVKHLHSPCSAPYIIHCMLQIQHVWALMAAEGWGNRSRQRFNNLHGGTDRARKPSQAAGLQGLCLQHPCHELHEVFWVSEGEVSWPRWHLPTQDASQVWVNLTLAPPSAPVSPGGAGCQGGRQAGGLASWVWLRGEIQPVLLVWAEKWAEPPQPLPLMLPHPPFPSNFSVFLSRTEWKWEQKKEQLRDFPGGPGVRPSSAGGVGLTPGGGSNIPHAVKKINTH